jgi:phosphoserine phosphatase RsbX
VTEIYSEELRFLTWSGVSKVHPDETVCGDAFLVKETENGAFLCLIDGLGHGTEAFLAANRTCSVINDFSGENILSLFAQCHEALKSTRGVVMSAAFIHHGSNTIEWTGIGNIEGLLLKGRSHEWLPLRGGIIGCRVPSLRSCKLTIEIDDMIVMYTDGISHTSTQSLIEAQPCDELAQSIISSQSKGTDDAAVLVARYKG